MAKENIIFTTVFFSFVKFLCVHFTFIGCILKRKTIYYSYNDVSMLPYVSDV